MELVNKNTDGTVGTGTEGYRVGVLTAASFSGDGSGITGLGVTYTAVAGVATLAEGLTGIPSLNVGIVTAQSFIGDGS